MLRDAMSELRHACHASDTKLEYSIARFKTQIRELMRSVEIMERGLESISTDVTSPSAKTAELTLREARRGMDG